MINAALAARLAVAAAAGARRTLAIREASVASINRVADAHSGKVRSALRNNWRAAALLVDDGKLTRALRREDRSGAAGIVEAAYAQVRERLGTALHDRLLECLVAGGEVAIRSARARGSWYAHHTQRRAAAGFTMTFNAKSPRAIAWAATRSAELVTAIDDSTQQAIRDMIAAGQEQGIAPAELSRLLREVVGLRPDQVDALVTFAAGGATQDQTDRYATQLLNQRAEMIARTETQAAANAGLHESWDQAVEADLLPPDINRIWFVGPNPCDDCAEADGQVVALGDPFLVGGEEVDDPPAHPHCVCGQGLTEEVAS